jgi:hypothetical protein
MKMDLIEIRNIPKEDMEKQFEEAGKMVNDFADADWTYVVGERKKKEN